MRAGTQTLRHLAEADRAERECLGKVHCGALQIEATLQAADICREMEAHSYAAPVFYETVEDTASSYYDYWEDTSSSYEEEDEEDEEDDDDDDDQADDDEEYHRSTRKVAPVLDDGK